MTVYPDVDFGINVILAIAGMSNLPPEAVAIGSFLYESNPVHVFEIPYPPGQAPLGVPVLVIAYLNTFLNFFE